MQSVKVFLVGDNRFCLELYKRHLHNLGYYTVFTFDNDTSCIDSLAQMPDIVFLDHDMDTVNCLELLKQIKNYNPDIYVILLSAHEDPDTVLRSFQYGAFDYIVKGEDELETITEALGQISEIKEQLNSAGPSFIRRILLML